MLAVHADFNQHPELLLDRQVNLLLFMNPDWDEQWGGHLELWDKAMSRPVVRIAPVLNRCVIFRTTCHSFHGHPDPLACPQDRTRRSIALYYYTSPQQPGGGKAAHGTLWQRRPHDPTLPSPGLFGRAAAAVRRRLRGSG